MGLENDELSVYLPICAFLPISRSTFFYLLTFDRETKHFEAENYENKEKKMLQGGKFSYLFTLSYVSTCTIGP